ncbi:MAG TPA: tetratricopeptide repeat protein [Candidatus Acidoferrales bacterium]|nr:tetratricopeptide repeat protein [Candidatus Acidoferrales bacterium]
MRIRWVVLAVAAMFCGALGGAILAPQPAGAVSREMIELQQTVNQLLQGQTDLRSAVDSNNATLRTLIQQSLDSVGKLNSQMDALQKTVQDSTANSGSRLDTVTQQTQGLSDNVQDIQSRVGKLSQQLTDMQNLLQSIDAKVSGGAPAGGAPGATQGAPDSNAPGATPPPNAPNTMNSAPAAPSSPAPGGGGGMPPISADTLYQNALRDYTSGNYTLARQEFSDYIKFFPTNDLASNSQFYLGEIAYQQNDFKGAIGAYEQVLMGYPHSFKLGASLLKKGMAELELGEKSAGIRDLRAVISRFPGSDESRRSASKLRELGVASHPTAR